MNRATVGSLILLAALLSAPRLSAHSALSVDANALWRVDLDTPSGEVEIPTLDLVGRFCLLGLLLVSALIILRRTGP